MKLVATLIVVVMLLTMVTVTAFAADAPATTSPSQVGQSLGTFLNTLYSAALRVVGLAIFVMFLIAGLGKIVPGMAVGNPEAILKDAVIGLVILVSAYVVLNSIHPNLVQIGAWLPEVPKAKTGVQNTNTGTGTGVVPQESDTITLRSGTESRTFIKPNGPCGQVSIAALPCLPGYICQGAVCKWSGENGIMLHAYCANTPQCDGSAECVSLYEFRDSPGLVQKCCGLDEIQARVGGGFYYCRN